MVPIFLGHAVYNDVDIHTCTVSGLAQSLCTKQTI